MSVPKPQLSRLYLLRHAQAAWPEPAERDFDRRLDQTGYAQAELMADRLADKGHKPELVLSSTAIRCRETTDALKRAFNDGIDISYVNAMYNTQPETYLDLVDSQDGVGSLMLVGHNPTIEGALEALIGQAAMDVHAPHGFPTAGLAILDAVTQAAETAPRWQIVEFLAP